MIRRSLSLLFFCFVALAFSYSQPEIRAVYTDTIPAINGFVNEKVWTQSSMVDEFFQREPRTGEPCTEHTEFLFLYDRNNLYIGIRCESPEGGITAKEMARDVSLGDDDRVQIILDTYLDGRNGYWFQIGPRGSIGDALLSENGKGFNKSWDGLWDGKARITEKGWEAELIIPFKTLAFKKGQDVWGLKLIRNIKKKSEVAYWPQTSLDADRFQVSDAGRISGLNNITQGIGLDLVPFVTTGVRKLPGKDREALIDAGLDAFYQVTPSLKAAVTVNTDFAQTEVDLKQINLTRFSLFYPEKRDFFLDGSNYFNFGINGDAENPHNTQVIPFFSRRIGLDPLGNPVAVKYGGKFTGQAGKWNMGFIHNKDDNEWDNPGYTVGRVTRNFGKQSSIGMIGTLGNSLSDDRNALAGFDLRLASSTFYKNKNIVLNVYGMKSFTPGYSDDDFSFGSELNYPNDFLNFRIGYLQAGEHFIAGLGFVPRTNIRNYYGSFRLGPRPKIKSILQFKTGLSYSLISDLKQKTLQSAEFRLNYGEIDFLSGDIIALSSGLQFESLTEEFILFQKDTIAAGEYTFWNHALQLMSAKRRNFWAAMQLSAGGFYSGTRTDWLMQLGYKVFVPVYVGIESDRKYIRLGGETTVAQIWRINLNLLFSPELSLYSFAQYDNQTETIGWQSRFQWIISPGREVFLVWNSPHMNPYDRFKQPDYEARLKVNYTVRF